MLRSYAAVAASLLLASPATRKQGRHDVRSLLPKRSKGIATQVKNHGDGISFAPHRGCASKAGVDGKAPPTRPPAQADVDGKAKLTQLSARTDVDGQAPPTQLPAQADFDGKALSTRLSDRANATVRAQTTHNRERRRPMTLIATVPAEHHTIGVTPCN